MMFNDTYGLTNAVLDGSKTKTRRIIPQYVLDKVPKYQEDYYEGTLSSISFNDAIVNMINNERMFKQIPYVGEKIAVAQNYAKTLWNISIKDYCDIIEKRGFDSNFIFEINDSPGWHNKMYVRPDFMLNFIKITELKVERLKEITPEDAIKEGVRYCKGLDCKGNLIPQAECYALQGGLLFPTPIDAYAFLIDHVCKKGTWSNNPLVLTYTFELTTKGILKNAPTNI